MSPPSKNICTSRLKVPARSAAFRPIVAIGWTVSALLLSSLGCSSVGSDAFEGTSFSSGGGPGKMMATGGTDPGLEPGGVPWMTRLARLTHSQYDNTASDLLGFDVKASAEFSVDPSFSGFDNDVDELRVGARLARDYVRSAEGLALAYMTQGDHSQWEECTEEDESCAVDFINEFGLRAYRRPLSENEINRFLALFSEGASLIKSGDDFSDGVQLVVEAMLSSPKFIYRTELNDEVGEDGFIRLDDYELASRLSYMLTNSMPDEQLLEAAKAGELTSSDGLQKQAERLSKGPGILRSVLDFHDQWLQLNLYENLNKDAEIFPAFSSSLEVAFLRETREFIKYVLLTEEKGLPSLLSAPYSMVNDELAELYGIEGQFDDEFVFAELDPSQRAGISTQPGFLAGHAYNYDTSPIHRGVFVLRQLLCQQIPDPPGDIDFTLPEVTDDIVTTRHQVELHTSQKSCTGCHSLINPVGFAYEFYDGIGRYRQEDNGEAVDAHGELELPEGSVEFEDAVEFAQKMAELPSAGQCYAKNWLRYAYARKEAVADQATVERLSQRVMDDDFSVRDLLVELTETKVFTHRAPNESD